MIKSTRYFQLTPDILVEYNYSNIKPIDNDKKNTEYIVLNQNNDEKKDAILTSLTNRIINTDYIFIDNEFDDININSNNVVIPVNKIKTKFVNYKGKYSYYHSPEIIDINYNNSYEYEYKENVFGLIYDTIKLRFTGRNYFNSYEGLIIEINIPKANGDFINFGSFLITRFDNVKIEKDPLLIDQKLYTTYIDFKIPSVGALLNNIDDSACEFSNLITNPNYTKIDINAYKKIKKNASITCNLYGIRYSVDIDDDFTSYNTEKINTISISSNDNIGDVSIEISEAEDGDYFIIKGKTENSESFSDFMFNYDEHPEYLMILHEITLLESYVDINNELHENEKTNKMHFMTNVVNQDGELYEKELDEPIYYRPICKYGSNCISFTIEDKMRIVNSYDNTTVIKIASYTYGVENGKNPGRYGKHMNKIYLGETPYKVNIYNKRDDEHIGIEQITNLSINNIGSGINIENHQHTIMGLVETINVGVSITQPTAIYEN